MDIKVKKLLVPVDLMRFATINRLIPEIRLYLYFKFVASGHLTKSNSLLQSASKELGISHRTVRRHINTLLRLKLITYNNRLKSLRTIGFLSLAKRNGFTSQYGVIMKKKDLQVFRLFAFSSCIEHELKKFRRVARSQRLPAINSERIASMSKPAPSISSSIPVNVISKKLSISPSRASYLKNASDKKGYLKVHKCFTPLSISEEFLTPFKQYMPPELAKKVRRIKGEFFIQEPDQVQSNLIFKRRRNFRKLCDKNRN